MQIKGVTSGVCVPKQLWSNQRLTLYRNGKTMTRWNDFEARPRPGCVRPDANGSINGMLKLNVVYPGARPGDRICYRFPYQQGGKLRSLSRCVTL